MAGTAEEEDSPTGAVGLFELELGSSWTQPEDTGAVSSATATAVKEAGSTELKTGKQEAVG